MNFEFVTGYAMAYVCPKSFAKNLGVFLSYHQYCINILIYNNYCIDYTRTLYNLINYFVCLADFGMPCYSSKLCAHIGKKKEELHFFDLTWSNFFLHAPSIRIFQKTLTSMDMIIVILYKFSPTHIIFTKC
jgi:hypothetical protein